VRGYATDAKNLGTVVLASDKDSGDIEVEFHAFDAQGIAGKRAVKIVDLVSEALGELGTPVYIGEIEKHIKDKGETLSNGAVSAALRTLGSMVREIKKTEKSKNGKWCLNEMDAFSELSDDGDDDDN